MISLCVYLFDIGGLVRLVSTTIGIGLCGLFVACDGIFSVAASQAMRAPTVALTKALEDTALTDGQRSGLEVHLMRAKKDQQTVAVCVSTNTLAYLALGVKWAVLFFGCSSGCTLRRVSHVISLVTWACSSMTNDYCIAQVSGLAQWRTPGAELSNQSLAALKKIALAATNAEECHRLEIKAYEMAEATNLAVPSAEVNECLLAYKKQLVHAYDAGDPKVTKGVADRMRALAAAEQKRLGGCMLNLWNSYLLMTLRSSSIDTVKDNSICTRQHVPDGLSSEAYFDWLYGEAATAEEQLRALIDVALSVINRAEMAEDIATFIPTGQTFNVDTITALMQGFDTSIHRSKKTQRPYVKMAPTNKKDRALAKALNDYCDCEAPIEAQLLDLARCTVLFDDPLTLTFFYGVLCAIADVVRVKNRFGKPSQRDIMLNLRVSSGHIVEVQLGVDSLMLLRSWDHPMYQIARTKTEPELVDVVRPKEGGEKCRPVLGSDFEDMALDGAGGADMTTEEMETVGADMTTEEDAAALGNPVCDSRALGSVAS